jgi:hypothetical protein
MIIRTMLRNTFLLLLSILFITGCNGQKDLKSKYSLLTWEYKREGLINEFQLVKYNWTDSVYTRKEIFKTSYYIPHYSHFKTTVYKDRYLINARGDVFDLHENKVVHDHIGDDIFLERRNDSVLFRHTDYQPNSVFPPDTARHNSITGDYYFFDIKTGRVILLTNSNNLIKYFSLSFPTKIIGSTLSPDKQQLVYFVPRKYILQNNLPVEGPDFSLCAWSRIFPTTGDIFLSNSKTDSVKLADSVIFNFSIWFKNELPIIWLTNEEILTQKFNGALIKINTKTKTITNYPVLQDAIPCSYPTSFERTATNEIIYYCRGKNGDLFKVNTDSDTVSMTTAIRITDIYSLFPKSGYAGYEYANSYSLNNKKILTDTTATANYAVTTDNLLAVQCKEITPSRNQYDYLNIIKIYDPIKNEWVEIKVEFLQQLIGWVKEK